MATLKSYITLDFPRENIRKCFTFRFEPEKS